jgi:AbrB family looped-hinge helix DNA binding protein
VLTLHTENLGQVTIPVPFCEQLGIKPGTLLEASVVGDHIELRPLPADPIAAFAGSIASRESLSEALIEEHRQEVERDPKS